MRRMLEKGGSKALRLPRGFHLERVQWLYDGLPTAATAEAATTSNKYLLYWMQTSVRTKYNYALEYAIAAANAMAVPLRVVYFLSDRSVVPGEGKDDPNSFGFATERHAKFGLEGLAAAHARLFKRGLSFHVFHHSHAQADGPSRSRTEMLAACAERAALVVTDRPYLRPWRKDLDQCAQKAEEEQWPCGIVQVESDVVVPCEAASPKEEYAARTIRPKIQAQLPKYLVELEHLEVSDAAKSADKASATFVPTNLVQLHVVQVQKVLDLLDVDRSVPVVSSFVGGEDQGVSLAKTFLENKLARYAEDRNEPAGDGGSNLSLYLRYGHISPVRIALAANKVKTTPKVKAGRESFLEEMIVRRELSVNMAVYNSHYDTILCLPEYATITLAQHAKDKREHLYTREQLENAETYDVYWNAAQMEVVHSGKMHGYMRMYWGKKILEWTKSPEEAYEIALHLNNKYALDAPDPNSYTGIAWTFGYASLDSVCPRRTWSLAHFRCCVDCSKHDQGWKERPIFGKVRYMNEAGLKRKFNMDGYLRKVRKLQQGASSTTLSAINPANEATNEKTTRTHRAPKRGSTTMDAFVIKKTKK
ncbi:TPA: hypothetical protein N0F65_012462 [Lagenidium giganteum]|uniref:Deoxyribodipyrimidine photo-lyase n=1 Tax=Lagenidium giganteum TaxID=4803 RepID=A0AAV2YH79_9STRA|nr:TPA: hypothetical protein N0F65_012462 [Lagenidium giganteum]